MSQGSLEGGRAPLIIVGMHRSGTSLLARTLEESGLFIGWRQQPGHGEAVFFQSINEWILREAGGSWEYPSPLIDIVNSPRSRKPVVDFMQFSLGSLRALSFLGPRRWPAVRTVDRLQQPWGWKDPRTTVVLPLWLEVFPDARVLHIQRHGVDVAASLRSRHRKLIDSLGSGLTRGRWKYQLVAPRERRAMGHRLESIDAGLELWATYEGIAEQATSTLGDRLLRLKYEDFLHDPTSHLRRINDFYPLGHEVNSKPLGFDEGRAYAYARDPELVRAADRHATLLAQYGYGSIDGQDAVP